LCQTAGLEPEGYSAVKARTVARPLGAPEHSGSGDDNYAKALIAVEASLESLHYTRVEFGLEQSPRWWTIRQSEVPTFQQRIEFLLGVAYQCRDSTVGGRITA
jgi:hypothetical protein